jgi:two-component system, LytTR family, sensor kinase
MRPNNSALFYLWGLFWLLMVAVALEDERHSHGVLWWQPLLWEGSSCLVGTVWLLLERRMASRWEPLLGDPLRWFGRHFAWLPVVVVTFIVSVYAIRHGVYALAGLRYEHDPWPQVFFYESLKLLLFSGLWFSIIFGLSSFGLWKQERERLLTLQKHLAESQLSQLRAQLQPHFLFNALNTISSLMQVDVERADRLLAQLAELLRSSLQVGERQMTSLRAELALLDLYARIMQERFAGRVTLRHEIADDTLDAEIPAMLLQPLLENAYKHGVERSSQPVAIAITASRDETRLHVTVRNTGELRAAAGGAGIGLRNCRERLELLFGDGAAIELVQEGDEVAAKLRLPWRRHAA